MNTFVIFLSRVVGFVVDRVLFKNERGTGPATSTTIVAELLLGIVAAMIVAWFSRWREFRADAGGAAIAGRNKMIAALERLKLNQEQSHPAGAGEGLRDFRRRRLHGAHAVPSAARRAHRRAA